MNNAAFSTGPRRRPGGAPAATAESPIPQQWWDQDAAAASQQTRGNYPYYGNKNSSNNNSNNGGNSNMNSAQAMNGHDNNNLATPTTQKQLSNTTAYYQQHRPATPSQSATQFASSYNPTPPQYGYSYRNASPTPANPRNGAASPNSMNSNPTPAPNAPHPPSSTGLIRLTLRKPMGIVFEPMVDASGQQRGVRICDLPRTGAAALSRKLEVGDELLSINDKTMSRLTFDEIMDFIIEADPERVNLLFRRPRKEALVKPSGGAAVMSGSGGGNSVKWVDDNMNDNNMNDKKSKKDKQRDRDGDRDSDRNNRRERERDRERDRSSSERMKDAAHANYSKSKRKKNSIQPYQSESFLDMLIDSLCSPLVHGDESYKDKKRENDRDEYSDYDDEGTYLSGDGDDSTYITYESTQENNKRGANRGDVPPKSNRRDVKKGGKRGNDRRSRIDDDSTADNETVDDETVDDTVDTGLDKEVGDSEIDYDTQPEKADVVEENKASDRHQERKYFRPNNADNIQNKSVYEDDATLETVDTSDRAKEQQEKQDPSYKFPLGLSPPWRKEKDKKTPITPTNNKTQTQNEVSPPPPPELPIEELEYNDQVDGADVSVMTPSLAENYVSSAALIHGKENYTPHEPGMTVDESIQKSPQRFYRHVVQHLLETHEPEKVRLLDKLMAKYKGREEHLIQKLTLRYNRQGAKQQQEKPDKQTPTIQEDQSFTEDFTKNKMEQKKPENLQPTNISETSSNKDSLASFVTDIANKSLNRAVLQSQKGNKPKSINEELSDESNKVPDTSMWQPVPQVESADTKSDKGEDRYENTHVRGSFEQKSIPEVVDEKSPDTSASIPKRRTDSSLNSAENVTNLEANISSQLEATPDMERKLTSESKEEKQSSAASSQGPTRQDDHDSANSGSFTEEGSGSEYTGSSIDGTSPAVIAQVSELLNFVYGKTSVPGQIDRVSTIMRAYEGREAVLLELLETKALIKANAQTDQVQDQQTNVTSPLSMSGPSTINVGGEYVQGRGEINDDISSVSGASSRIVKTPNTASGDKSFMTSSDSLKHGGVMSDNNSSQMPSIMGSIKYSTLPNEKPSTKETVTNVVKSTVSSEPKKTHKKKKSIFGIFKSKKGNKKSGGFPGEEDSTSSFRGKKGSQSKKKEGLLTADSEASI